MPFVKSLRTRNRFSASTVDQVPHQLVAWQMFGHQLLLPIPDLDRTSYLLVLGANPMASNGSLMTAPDFPNRAKAIKQRGGRIVVLDPRRTETAAIATEHVFVRPGGDVVVLLAMLRTILAEGLARPPAYVDGLDELRALVDGFTPALAEQVSAVPAETVERLARELCETRGAAAYGRLGVSATGFGSVSQWAINCLNLLAGDFDRPGGVMFPEPAVDVVGRRFVGTGHFDLYRSRVRGLPEYGGELPAACMREEIETPGDGQIRAFVSIAGNPVLSTPDGRRLGEAFDSLDFMAAIDIYLNETTRHADVILPPTTALERDHYDLVFHGLAVRNTARFSSAVFAKPRRRHARLGDLPRADRAGRRAAAPEGAAEGAGSSSGCGCAPAPRSSSRCCCAPDVVRRSGSSGRTPRASTSGRCCPPCPAACRPRATGSTWCPGWSSTTSSGCGPGWPTGPTTRSC